ncbi:MAG: 23S rRNA (pseudouridine(1915)-N(3))-methyltransferase RlmH [Campylobacterales bacterium]
MTLRVFYIAKASGGAVAQLEAHYQKMISAFGRIELIPIFNKTLEKAQKAGREAARAAYTQALAPHLAGAFCVAMDERGKTPDSPGFAKLIDVDRPVHLMIGGAYGLEESFVGRCDAAVSLSRMTLSHELARLVLLEQCYRALSILNSHPYHK